MCSGTGRFPSIATLILAILLPLTAPPAGAGTIVVRPGKLDHFVMSAPESAVAGESFLVRIEPYDASGNLISDAQNQSGNFNIVVSGSAEASPARIKPADFAGGITVKVVDKRSEEIELSVVEAGANTPLSSVRIPVWPNKLDHFSLNVPKEATAGEFFQCRVIAQDAFGNTKIDLPDIRSSLKVEFHGVGTVQVVGKGLPAFRSGEMILSLEPRKAGLVKVVVQETNTHSGGESGEVRVRSTHLDHFIVQAPKAATAGEKFAVTISAYDAFDNLVADYSGQGDGIDIQASGTGELSPSSVPAKAFRQGQAKVEFTYTKAEQISITAREVNQDLTGKSEPIAVAPAGPDHFTVVSPDEAVAGEPFVINVTALDRFNNLIEDYDLRGLEVHLATDGRGTIVPAMVSPAAFKKGKASVEISYNRAESFSVVAALSKESLEKIIRERGRKAPAQEGPPALSPEDINREKERVKALELREEAKKAKIEAEQNKAREEAVMAREAARSAREEAIEKTPLPEEPVSVPLPPPVDPPKKPVARPVKVAKPALQVLERISLMESGDQAMVLLETTGPVSYNAQTGSALSKEWLHIELFPAKRNKEKVADSIPVDSQMVGEIVVAEEGPDKVRVSLQLSASGVSYVVSQQDRAVVVKVIKAE